MTRIILCTLSVFLACSLFSKEQLLLKDAFKIISDTLDNSIEDGKCVFEINVIELNTENTVANVVILSGENIFITNKKGYCVFEEKNTISYLKFSANDYEDVYIEDYEFKSRHRICVNVYMISNREILLQEEEPRPLKKPVLYAYSDVDTHFQFTIIPNGTIFFSYPQLDSENKWSVYLKNNVIYDSLTNSEYPYLFWESYPQNIDPLRNSHYSRLFSMGYRKPIGYKARWNLDDTVVLFEGTIVHSDSLLSFLDTSLTQLNFSPKEKTDFITFWGPEMKKHPYCFVQFLIDDECEQFASYEINPTPDQLNRVYMLFSSFDKFPTIQTFPQKFSPMKRKGFYLVDWGGMHLPIEQKSNNDYEN